MINFRNFFILQENDERGEIDPSENNWGFRKTLDIRKINDNLYRSEWNDHKITIFPYQGGWCMHWDMTDGTAENFYYLDRNLENSHRLDGPAVSHKRNSNPMEIFYINGKILSREDYWKHPEVLAAQKVKPEDRETMSDLLKI